MLQDLVYLVLLPAEKHSMASLYRRRWQLGGSRNGISAVRVARYLEYEATTLRDEGKASYAAGGEKVFDFQNKMQAAMIGRDA